MSGQAPVNLDLSGIMNQEEEEVSTMPDPESEAVELDEASRTTRRRTRSRAQNILTSPSGLMNADDEQQMGSGFNIARRTLLGS